MDVAAGIGGFVALALLTALAIRRHRLRRGRRFRLTIIVERDRDDTAES